VRHPSLQRETVVRPLAEQPSLSAESVVRDGFIQLGEGKELFAAQRRNYGSPIECSVTARDMKELFTRCEPDDLGRATLEFLSVPAYWPQLTFQT
jgi:hypothetical protein